MRLTTLAAAVLVSAAAVPAFAEDLQFTLINNASQPLTNLYISLPEADAWGDDILGVDVLGVGESATVTITDGADVCAYDLQFVMENEAMVEGTANLCETNEFTLHD